VGGVGGVGVGGGGGGGEKFQVGLHETTYGRYAVHKLAGPGFTK